MRELGYVVGSLPEANPSEALVEARRAIAELQHLDDPEAMGDAWWLVAIVGNLLGDFSLKEDAAARRLESASRAGLRAQAIGAASHLVAALSQGPRPVGEAIPLAERAIARFPVERPGGSFLGTLYAMAGRHREAEEAIDQSRRTLLEFGKTMSHAASSMDAGWIALLAGDPARAEPELRAGVEFLEDAGEFGWFSTVAAVLAEVLYQLEEREQSELWTRRSEQAASADDATSQALWRSTRAKIMARRGEAEGGEQLSTEAIEEARRTDNLMVLGDCLSARAEVLRLLGHVDEARPVYEQALAVYQRKGIVPYIERTKQALAELG
jgi:tetratricopeptide (TPR) repeat protein